MITQALKSNFILLINPKNKTMPEKAIYSTA